MRRWSNLACGLRRRLHFTKANPHITAAKPGRVEAGGKQPPGSSRPFGKLGGGFVFRDVSCCTSPPLHESSACAEPPAPGRCAPKHVASVPVSCPRPRLVRRPEQPSVTKREGEAAGRTPGAACRQGGPTRSKPRLPVRLRPCAGSLAGSRLRFRLHRPSQTSTDPYGQKNGAIGDGSPMRRDRAGPEASQRFRPEAVLRPLQRGCCVLPVGRPSPTVPTSSHLPPSVRSDRIPVATVRQMPRVRYAVVCDRTAGERSGAAHRNQRFVRHLREALLDQRSGCAARLVPSGGSATLHFSLRRDRHEGQAEKRIPHRH